MAFVIILAALLAPPADAPLVQLGPYHALELNHVIDVREEIGPAPHYRLRYVQEARFTSLLAWQRGPDGRLYVARWWWIDDAAPPAPGPAGDWWVECADPGRIGPVKLLSLGHRYLIRGRHYLETYTTFDREAANR